MKEILHRLNEKSLRQFINEKLILFLYNKTESNAAKNCVINNNNDTKNVSLDKWREKFLALKKKVKQNRFTKYGEKVLNLYLPEDEFVYIARGSSGLIFVNSSHPDRVYKVAYIRKKGGLLEPDTKLPEEHIRYFKREQLTLEALSDSGITPRLFSVSGIDFVPKLMDSETPIFEMERIFFDNNWRRKLSKKKLNTLIEDFFVEVTRYNLILADTEIAYDSINDKLRIVDLGGVSIGDKPHYTSVAQLVKKVLH